MKNILNICKNEIRTIFNDKGSLLVMVIAIFLYSLFYPMPFFTQVLRDVPIGVVDLDNSNLSRVLTRNIDSNEFVKVTSSPIDAREAKDQFYSNKIKAYVVIPTDFEKDIFQGKQSNIGLFVDSSYLIIYKQVATGISQSVMALSARLEVGKAVKSGINKRIAIRIKQPFEFAQIPLFNPAGAYENYIYPLVLILILQQTMLVGIGLLGGTRKDHKLRALKAGDEHFKFCKFSDNPYEIVIGKSLAYVSLYMCYAMIYFLLYPLIFGYKINYQILPLIAVVIPYLTAVSFLGQALVQFFRERESSLMLIVVTSVPMIFLPGFVWPKEAIPTWLRIFSNFIPSTSGTESIIRINQLGASFAQVQSDFWILIGLCIFYFILACLVTKKLCK